MTTTLEFTRRQFLKATTAIGGGLALEFSFPGWPPRRPRPPRPATK
jgi:hypothetical protein